MKCACCGRRKRFFEALENIDDSIAVCSECSRLLYELRDATDKENHESLKKELVKRSKKKKEEHFEKWLNEQDFYNNYS